MKDFGRISECRGEKVVLLIQGLYCQPAIPIRNHPVHISYKIHIGNKDNFIDG